LTAFDAATRFDKQVFLPYEAVRLRTGMGPAEAEYILA
jgi:hypothetical protein